MKEDYSKDYSKFYELDKLKMSKDSTLFNIRFETPIIRFMPSPSTGKTFYYQSYGRGNRNGNLPEIYEMSFEMSKECIIKKYLDLMKK